MSEEDKQKFKTWGKRYCDIREIVLNQEILIFNDVVHETCEFECPKNPNSKDNIDVHKTLISNKVSSDKE